MPSTIRIVLLGVSAAVAVLCGERCISTADARGPEFAECRVALEGRWKRADKLRVKATWRTYRCSDSVDWLDKSKWLRPLAGIDPDYDISYSIVRPWMYFELKNVNRPGDFTPAMSWVDGRLTARSRTRDGRPAYHVVSHLNYSTLRGMMFFTPIELEMFDTKRPFVEMMSEVADADVKRVGDSLVEVAFISPMSRSLRMRGLFDTDRDWVPVELEQFIPAEGRRKEMRFLLKSIGLRALEHTFIISDAVIMNSNPNVLPGMLVITHYHVDHAEMDDSLTVDSLRIMPSHSNSVVLDDVELTYHEFDEGGRAIVSKQRTPEDLARHGAAMRAAAEEAIKAGEQRRTRRAFFWMLSIAAAACAGGAGYWFRRRARAFRV